MAMHSIRSRAPYLPLLALLSLAPAAQAQVVESVVVAKMRLHGQSTATQVDLLSPANLPFGIDLDVDGVNIDLLSPAPWVSGPIAVPEPNHNGGVLGINPNDGYWRYGFPNFDDWGTTSQAELDTLFGSGVYTFHVAGVTVPLTLTGDLYAAAPPVITLGGGFWASGTYYVESDQVLTLTSSAYPEYGTHFDDAVNLIVHGPNVDLEALEIASLSAQNFATLTIPANTLVPGAEYEVDSSFIAAVDLVFSVPGLPTALAASTYEMSTLLRVVALPPGPGTPYCFGDGHGTACPCGNVNDGSNGPAGCANGASSGGAAITGAGTPSVGADTVVLSATGLQANQPGLWFRADNAVNGGAGNPFGDGLRCAGGNIVRLGVVVSDALGQSSSPAGLGAGLAAGDVKRYQYWYRNPAASPCGTAFNLSNGYEITWLP